MPAHLQFDGRPARGARHRELRDEPLGAEGRADLGSGEVGRLLQAECNDPRARHRPPEAREPIIRIDDRSRVRRKACDHLAFRTRYAFQTAEALEVLGSGVGDQANGGP